MDPQDNLCYLVTQQDGNIRGQLTRKPLHPLKEGEVRIRAQHSSINFKDALGATGKGKILRSFPMVAGIDVAGTVDSSRDGRFQKGQEVLVTGCGLGEEQDGGFAEFVQVPADWIVPKPSGLTLWETMCLGTAGFTAALCLHHMETNGQSPQQGPLVITGASGGVGSLAVNIFSSKAYEVLAVSGKTDSANRDYLFSLGAHQVINLEDLHLGDRPLERARFAGAIDNLGGEVLGKILGHIQLSGNVASVGLAMGAALKITVMPFILRGVNLLGISSANCPMPLRQKLWQRLGSDLKPKNLRQIVTEEVNLSGLDNVFQRMMERKTHGRIVVHCHGGGS